ncbi:uncharacterized protein LOC122067035 [Macadamia integrifolia]|uniref:uncharacterized protein LOC122067035 n=1 Tax=Macadamia integrifolia TaxID=60698 RepID=UPI001C4EC6DF|nr:uncharacterized protein LOC122067035 [Macadamia integrifolia]
MSESPFTVTGDGPGGGFPPDRGRQLRLTDFWKAHPPMEKAVLDGGKEPSAAANKSFASIVGSDTEASAKVTVSTDQIPHKSYANVVGSNTPMVDELPDPVHAGNSTKVIIPQEAYEDRLLKYRFALIGRINFRFLSLDDVRREARESWKLKGKVKMIPMGKGFTIFQFESEHDMAQMWKRSPVKIGGQLVRFQRWRPDFSIHEKLINKVLVWVRFPDLPLEYWHEKVLLTMAKAVGRPVGLDQRTKSVIYGNYARVLMEMEVGVPRLEEIQVERKQPGTQILFWFKQQLIYEDSLGKCGFCKKLGHQVHACREKKAYDERQNARANAEIPGAVYEEDRVNLGTSNSPVCINTSLERRDHDLVISNSKRVNTDGEGEILNKEAHDSEEIQSESSDSDKEALFSDDEVGRSDEESSSESGQESDRDMVKEGEPNQLGSVLITGPLEL